MDVLVYESSRSRHVQRSPWYNNITVSQSAVTVDDGRRWYRLRSLRRRRVVIAFATVTTAVAVRSSFTSVRVLHVAAVVFEPRSPQTVVSDHGRGIVTSADRSTAAADQRRDLDNEPARSDDRDRLRVACDQTLQKQRKWYRDDNSRPSMVHRVYGRRMLYYDDRSVFRSVGRSNGLMVDRSLFTLNRAPRTVYARQRPARFHLFCFLFLFTADKIADVSYDRKRIQSKLSPLPQSK